MTKIRLMRSWEKQEEKRVNTILANAKATDRGVVFNVFLPNSPVTMATKKTKLNQPLN